MAILEREPDEMDMLASPCVPVFREGISFHDQDGEILGMLNICFECHMLRDGFGTPLSLDLNAFIGLRAVLKKLGHSFGH